MANELIYSGLESEENLEVVVNIFNTEGVMVAENIDTTETAPYCYIGDMPTVDAGEYLVRFYADNILLRQGKIYWDGEKETNLLELLSIKAYSKEILRNSVEANQQTKS